MAQQIKVGDRVISNCIRGTDLKYGYGGIIGLVVRIYEGLRLPIIVQGEKSNWRLSFREDELSILSSQRKTQP